MTRIPKQTGKICKSRKIGFYRVRNLSLCENEASDPRKGFFLCPDDGRNWEIVSDCWACILEFSESGQVRGLERIQDTRKNWAQAEPVYSKIQGLGRLLVNGVYRKLEEPGPRAGSWFGAYVACSKSLDPSRTCILKFQG